MPLELRNVHCSSAAVCHATVGGDDCVTILSGARRVGAVGLVVGGLLLVSVGGASASTGNACEVPGVSGTYVTPNACIPGVPPYEDASNNLSIAYDPVTSLPITQGEANVVIDVTGASPDSTPTVFGIDSKDDLFNAYDGPEPDPTPTVAFCTVADASGDATCYISVPADAEMPVTFTVTDQVAITSNQLPEVPFAAGLPLLLALALPARKWLRRRQGTGLA